MKNSSLEMGISMKIVRLECRRMMGRALFWGFVIFVLAVSVYDCHKSLKRYDPYEEGSAWRDNLAEAKRTSEGLKLDRACMENLREDAEWYGFVNGENISELVSSNYDGKPLEELSDEEMDRFFQIRARTIKENLVLDTSKGYTEKEIADLTARAESLHSLSLGYAEGWKALEERMGNFVFLLVAVISALVLQLFGRDPAVKMEELVRSSRYGKRPLDRARITAAYFTATVLYACSMAAYFVIVMWPFGFDGAGQPIQSNARTFFSCYNITYLRQFLWNLLIGYVVLVFMVSLTLLVTILFKSLLTSGAVIAIFLLMLVIFDQIYLYPVNHWFTNFLPVRMMDFWSFYTGNELYRFCGKSFSCMSFCTAVSLFLSAGLLSAGTAALRVRRRRGMEG